MIIHEWQQLNFLVRNGLPCHEQSCASDCQGVWSRPENAAKSGICLIQFYILCTKPKHPRQ